MKIKPSQIPLDSSVLKVEAGELTVDQGGLQSLIGGGRHCSS